LLANPAPGIALALEGTRRPPALSGTWVSTEVNPGLEAKLAGWRGVPVDVTLHGTVLPAKRSMREALSLASKVVPYE